MSFNNPLMPWRELNRTLSWTRHGDLELVDETSAEGTSGSVDGREPGGAPVRAVPIPSPTGSSVPYAELHAHSAYSFLDGASTPRELVAEAVRLGLSALAITDHDGLYGAVQLAQAAKGTALGTVFGAELSLAADRTERTGMPDPPGAHLLLLARDPDGYRSLSRAIGEAKLRGEGKGLAVYELEGLAARAGGRWAVLTGCRKGLVPRALARGGPQAAARELDRLRALFGRDNVAVELIDHDQPEDDARNDALAELAARHRALTIVTNQVHYAAPRDFPTACALAALRARRTLEEIDGWLPPGPTAHLRSGAETAERFARFPGILARTVDLAAECAFDFAAVAPSLPEVPVPDGFEDDISWLRHLVMEGARERYGTRRERPDAYRQLDYELGVIAKYDFAGYFLIVHGISTYCREQGILAQGRGSAANSAVCYALGITAVDPVAFKLVFERFLSPEREGYPDIDLDIESSRREEVIQHVYRTYGRTHAAQVANVITYRGRMAVRDAARVLGYPTGAQDAWARGIGPYTGGTDLAESAVPEDVLDLATRLHGLPRHLGIHSGGMVLCDRPVAEVCPTEWARMENRSVVQWDKDDCADGGLVKFDLLGLGMLGALHDAFDLVREHHGVDLTLGRIPTEDPEVYEMLCAADSIGVFQVESRAQMATLPRLKPREFYDLVVEIALIRPGPVQGGAVHPYMRRRAGQEKAEAPHPLLEEPLKRTLGVPLFQEQVMQMAVAAAGFAPAQADQLRRAMGAKRSTERMLALKEQLMSGMAAKGITGELAEDIYAKLEAFSSYGFPESHSISFAYLVYASSYLKRHYPAAFTAALLRNQPMGFYSPASLIGDARRHGVTVLGPDVNASAAQATLTEAPGPYRPTHPFASKHPQPAIRLGLAAVRALGESAAERVVQEREGTSAYGLDPEALPPSTAARPPRAHPSSRSQVLRSPSPSSLPSASAPRSRKPFTSLEDFVRRTNLSKAALEALATAGAFACFGLTRREALWQAGALAGTHAGHLPGTAGAESVPPLPEMTVVEQTFADLWAAGASPDSHPIAHMREKLRETGHVSIADLAKIPNRHLVRVAGIVTHRQRPPTAGGVCFLSLEDETGLANIVCSPTVWEQQKKVALNHGALRITGHLERSDHGAGAINIVAGRLEPLRVAAQPSNLRGRDFR
jgi:error-prone DNA polymerase